MSLRKPHCKTCNKRDVCTAICKRMDRYLHSVIPSDYGKEYPIGVPIFVKSGHVSRKTPYKTDALKVLTKREQQVLALRVVNTPVQEIAKMLNISPKYIKSFIYQARQKMRPPPAISDNGEESIADDSGTQAKTRRREVT